MFRNAKVGDRVWDFVWCWGTIEEICLGNKYPLAVKFDNNGIKGKYKLNGVYDAMSDTNPRLFWNEIKFEIPEKPFSLEKELRKLEVQEFENGAVNYYLLWDNEYKKIKQNFVNYCQNPFDIFFTEDSLFNFIDNIKNKKITKEEFFAVYKNVFGGKNAN